MDITKDNLGLNPDQLSELQSNLNIIVNAAGAVDFNTNLDRAIDTNVNGSLKLWHLAE